MSEGKREFWIHPGVEAWQNDEVVMNPACKKDHHIHVIEKSAFDTAVELIKDIEPSMLPEGLRLRRQQILRGENGSV